LNTQYLMNISQYWPVLVVVGFLGFKYYRAKKAKKEIAALGDVSKVQFVDVRSLTEFSNYSLPCSVNIPLQTIKAQSDQLDKQRPVVVFCATGTRSAGAKSILKGQGFTKVINGGTLKNIQSFLDTQTS
jgi:phage shock protein E